MAEVLVPDFKVDESIHTLIGKASRLTGTLSSEHSVRIEGILEGKMNCQGVVYVSVGGKVEGDISASSAIISGDVHGNVSVSGVVELLPTGNITGNIRGKSLFIAPGAQYNGEVTVEQISPLYNDAK